MPKYKNLCPDNIEIDLYSGCEFKCVYCIAKNRHKKTIRPLFDKTELENFVNRNKYLNIPFYISPWTDPYQDLEKKYKLTEKLLKHLYAIQASYFVLTKGTLIKRDINYFIHRDNTFIAISLNTVNNNITSKIEPEAPCAKERMDLIEYLTGIKGLKTVVKIDPIIPGLTDDKELEHLKKWLLRIKPFAVTVETARFTDKLFNNLKEVLTESESNKIINKYPPLGDEPKHPFLSYRLPVFEALAKEFSDNKIRISFCRASLPEKLTKYDCRGGF